MFVDKKWIEDHTFTKTGGMNNRVWKLDWWTNRGFDGEWKNIHEQTSFLDESANVFQRLYHIYHTLWTIPQCKQKNCTKCPTFKQFKSGYEDYCSKECSYLCEERNSKIRDNSDYVDRVNKVRETNLERYGVVSTFQLELVKEKSSQTKRERYGDPTWNNLEKNIETCMERYGVPHSTMVPEVIEKIRISNRITRNTPEANVIISLNQDGMSITEIANQYNVTYRSAYLWTKTLNNEPFFYRTTYGKLEDSVCDKIPLGFVRNVWNVITPKELDIWYPEQRVAIELNGEFWHSENKIGKNAHLNKLQMCQEKDIRLLQFWSHEWLQKPEICLSIIRNNLGLSNRKIGARRCKVAEISHKEYSDFLNENHIQGSINTSIRRGLIFDGELVSVFGLNRSRFGKETDRYEIVRFCTKLNTIVNGSFGKFFKEFSDWNLVTYADKRLFDGRTYARYMTFSHDSTPNYFWWKGSKLLTRMSTQKHRLPVLLGDGFNPSLSETDNMTANGWDRIWDCGNSVFVSNFSVDNI